MVVSKQGKVLKLGEIVLEVHVHMYFASKE